jgi:hypothetical protein
MLLNMAEGNSKRHGAIAPNSLMTLVARHSSRRLLGCIGRQRAHPARAHSARQKMLGRVVAMLTRLIDRFDVDDPLIRKD